MTIRFRRRWYIVSTRVQDDSAKRKGKVNRNNFRAKAKRRAKWRKQR